MSNEFAASAAALLHGAAAVALAVGSATAAAGEVDVLSVTAEQTARMDDVGLWRIEVTIDHADEGWSHYANRIEVMAPNGALLGDLTLHHPHVGEMPLTRTLPGVDIPLDVTRIIVRGHDLRDGYGGARIEMTLPEPGADGQAAATQ